MFLLVRIVADKHYLLQFPANVNYLYNNINIVCITALYLTASLLLETYNIYIFLKTQITDCIATKISYENSFIESNSGKLTLIDFLL